MAMNYVNRGETSNRDYFTREENDQCVELLRVWQPIRIKEISRHVKTPEQTMPPVLDSPIPEFVASSILKICTKVSIRFNYVNYPFREDMVSEAVYNILRYLHSFDVEKIGERSKRINFFSWVTKCADRSYGAYIGSEERQDYCKNAAFIYSGTCNDLLEDEGESGLVGFSPQIQNDFIDRAKTYEQKQDEVRRITKEKHKAKMEKVNEGIPAPKPTTTTLF